MSGPMPADWVFYGFVLNCLALIGGILLGALWKHEKGRIDANYYRSKWQSETRYYREMWRIERERRRLGIPFEEES